MANRHSQYSHMMPAIYVKYELSSVAMKYNFTNQEISHFLIEIFAIIGGIFTIAGLLDSLIGSILPGKKTYVPLWFYIDIHTHIHTVLYSWTRTKRKTFYRRKSKWTSMNKWNRITKRLDSWLVRLIRRSKISSMNLISSKISSSILIWFKKTQKKTLWTSSSWKNSNKIYLVALKSSFSKRVRIHVY